MNVCISSHTNYIQFTNKRSTAVGLELMVFIRIRDNVQNIISLNMRKPDFMYEVVLIQSPCAENNNNNNNTTITKQLATCMFVCKCY